MCRGLVINRMMLALCRLEGSATGEVDTEAFIAASDVDSERCHERPVEPRTDTVTGLEPVQVEIATFRRHLAGIDEERHVEMREGSQRYSALNNSRCLSRKRKSEYARCAWLPPSDGRT